MYLSKLCTLFPHYFPCFANKLPHTKKKNLIFNVHFIFNFDVVLVFFFGYRLSAKRIGYHAI